MAKVWAVLIAFITGQGWQWLKILQDNQVISGVGSGGACGLPVGAFSPTPSVASEG